VIKSCDHTDVRPSQRMNICIVLAKLLAFMASSNETNSAERQEHAVSEFKETQVWRSGVVFT